MKKLRQIVLVIMGSFLLSNIAFADFANVEGCVYNKRTGAPIEHALISVQSQDSAAVGSVTTQANGCTYPGSMGIYTEFFHGDYIEASIVVNGRKYLQQYQIPNRLIEQTYHYDFFLDIPLRPQPAPLPNPEPTPEP